MVTNKDFIYTLNICYTKIKIIYMLQIHHFDILSKSNKIKNKKRNQRNKKKTTNQQSTNENIPIKQMGRIYNTTAHPFVNRKLYVAICMLKYIH